MNNFFRTHGDIHNKKYHTNIIMTGTFTGYKHMDDSIGLDVYINIYSHEKKQIFAISKYFTITKKRPNINFNQYELNNIYDDVYNMFGDNSEVKYEEYL